MNKIFKNSVLSIFMAGTFFLSQIVNANAYNLQNISQKENMANYVTEQKENTTYKAVRMAALHIPAVSYGTENGTIVGGKVEKVLEPITIGLGLLCFGYAISFVSSLIGWIKDITLMFK